MPSYLRITDSAWICCAVPFDDICVKNEKYLSIRLRTQTCYRLKDELNTKIISNHRQSHYLSLVTFGSASGRVVFRGSTLQSICS